MANKSTENMTCREVSQLLPAFVECELEGSLQAHVQAHVARCAACAEEAKRYKGALGCLASVPRLKAPETMRLEIMALVRAEERRRQAARPFRWAAAAACMLLVVAASAVVLNRSGLNSEPVEPADHGKVVSPTPVAAAADPLRREAPPSAIAKNQVVSAPVRARDASPRAPSRVASAPVSFLDVKAKDGYSAREKIAMRRRAAAALAGSQLIGQGVPVPGAPRGDAGEFTPREAVEYSQPQSERLMVGGNSSVVRTETGFDRQGKIAVIRIRVEKDDANPSDRLDGPEPQAK